MTYPTPIARPRIMKIVHTALFPSPFVDSTFQIQTYLKQPPPPTLYVQSKSENLTTSRWREVAARRYRSPTSMCLRPDLIKQKKKSDKGILKARLSIYLGNYGSQIRRHDRLLRVWSSIWGRYMVSPVVNSLSRSHPKWITALTKS